MCVFGFLCSSGLKWVISVWVVMMLMVSVWFNLCCLILVIEDSCGSMVVLIIRMLSVC